MHFHAVCLEEDRMMKRNKGILTIVLAMLLAVSLVSCRKDEREYLSVTSTDYVNLERLELCSLDEQEFLDVWESNAYDAYYCFVSKTNTYGDQPERLVVNNSRTEHIHSCFGSSGYFVGADYTEFASGITFYTYTGMEPIAGDELPEARCVALLSNEDTDQKCCYAVTSWNCFDPDGDVTSVYRLDFPTEENGYGCEKLCDVAEDDNAVAATMTDDNRIWILTDFSLYSVSTEGHVTVIDVPEQLPYLRVTSMVSIGDDLYIGTKYGVLVYDIADGRFLWYPVNYEEVLPVPPQTEDAG